MNGSRFWVIGTIDQAADTSVNQGSRAHGARLNCNKQVAVDQTVVSEVGSRFAKRNHLGVSGGIVVGNVAIRAASDDASLMQDDGADGHFSGFEGTLGAAKRLFHPEFVGPEFVGSWLMRRQWQSPMAGSRGAGARARRGKCMRFARRSRLGGDCGYGRRREGKRGNFCSL
jgi:hypothetical protein